MSKRTRDHLEAEDEEDEDEDDDEEEEEEDVHEELVQGHPWGVKPWGNFWSTGDAPGDASNL
jgi:hypothetical protein